MRKKKESIILVESYYEGDSLKLMEKSTYELRAMI